ncbi:MAG: hypothetical protein Q7K71_01315 [Candidatus Omnitrophota bacterium]|nr:hypothetical protein [Candidatus Omnitrophota bacterium]
MTHSFELINNFVTISQQRINLFWDIVNGGKDGFKNELTLMLLVNLSMLPLLIGFVIIFNRIKFHHSYFIGMERLSNLLPNIFAVTLNISLWLSYFLLSVAIMISCFKLLSHNSDTLNNKNRAELVKNFTPSETVIFSSLKVAAELDKYAKAKVPSDFGLGGDIDWIEGCFYKILSGKRPTGSYRGPNIESNSFFADLKDEKDISDRLELSAWYSTEEIHDEEIFQKLFKLRDYISNYYLWHDYSLGAEVYKSLAQTFLAAHLKEKAYFKENLDYTVELYEKYSKTKSPLKGLPLFAFRFTPKVILVISILSSLIIISILVFLLPQWIVLLSERKLNLYWKINDVKEITQIFLAIVGILFAIIWRK